MFIDFFGDYPLIKVLDFLVENNVFDYSKKEICRQTGVSWNTLELFWPKLEKDQLIVFTRKVGKASLFKLNSNSLIAKQLIELDNLLIKQSLGKIQPKRKLVLLVQAGSARKK